MSPEVVAERIQRAVPEAEVRVEGADCNFSVTVTSTHFEGAGLLERQRRILGVFEDELREGSLHALSVVAKTPEEMARAAAQTASQFVQIVEGVSPK